MTDNPASNPLVIPLVVLASVVVTYIGWRLIEAWVEFSLQWERLPRRFDLIDERLSHIQDIHGRKIEMVRDDIGRTHEALKDVQEQLREQKTTLSRIRAVVDR